MIPPKIPPQEEINSLIINYQNGKFKIAMNLALLMSKKFPDHPLSWKVLGALFTHAGQMDKALVANQNAVRLDPKDINSHFNLGVILKELGKFKEAELSYSQALSLKPDYADAHNNLGNILKELGKLEQAEVSFNQAIALKPNSSQTHYNLGVVLKELGKLEQAEVSYKRAIALKPDFADAYSNLGSILKDLGKLEEAEVSYRKSIALMPDYADTYFNLGIILYINGNIDSALESMEKANSIDPKSKKNRLLLNIFYAKRGSDKDIKTLNCNFGLKFNPLVLKRVVEPNLIKSLYEMNSRELDRSKDARYGNGRCSLDFDLFEDSKSILKIVSDDLIHIMSEAVKSDVYVYDSFFNILGAGGGSKPHSHISSLDKDKGLNLRNKKYSLVYYLCAGDQSSSEPGILKLYDPMEDILPYEGMIVIIPASRKHSAVYNGSKDRVMIGINFYSL